MPFTYPLNNVPHVPTSIPVWGDTVWTPLAEAEWVRDRVPPTAGAPVTRFSGVVGDTHILVTGGPITVNRTAGEVVIQAADVTVRVKLVGNNEGGISR